MINFTDLDFRLPGWGLFGSAGKAPARAKVAQA